MIEAMVTRHGAAVDGAGDRNAGRDHEWRSCTGRRWVLRVAAPMASTQLARSGPVDANLADFLAGRGLSGEALEAYLQPRLDRDLPHPHSVTGMRKAAGIFAESIRDGLPIAIHGDYDVDGLTGTAMVVRFLRALGIEPQVFVPDRLRDGYGLRPEGVLALARTGIRVLLTIDCGVRSHAALAAARDAGIEVVVLDHHLPDASLPLAGAIVDPHRVDDSSGLEIVCAAGLAFLFLVAVRASLREAGFYLGRRRAPDLRSCLDLAALGTICDVVPLVGINRLLVVRGLDVLACTRKPGLRALMDLAGCGNSVTSEDVAMRIGPRLNAPSRCGEKDVALALLLEEDPVRARSLAERCEFLNRLRRQVEQEVTAAAIRQVAALGPRTLDDHPDPPVIVASGKGWHRGVLGVTAARLRARFQVPSLAIDAGGSVAVGSGRSIPGVNLGEAIVAAQRLGIVQAGGGHAMAAGVTLAAQDVPRLRAFLMERLAEPVIAARAEDALALDGWIQLSALHAELGAQLSRAAPFGAGNPPPCFALDPVRITHLRERATQAWLSCTLEDLKGYRNTAILYASPCSPLRSGLAQAYRHRHRIALAVALRFPAPGASPRLVIEDVASAGFPLAPQRGESARAS